MRTVTTPVTQAITTGTTYKALTRLTLYKSRVYFSSYNDTNEMSAAKGLGDSGYPISESIYPNTTISKLITAGVNDDGNLVLAVQGDDEVEVTYSGSPIAVNPKCRVGLFESTVYYQSSSDNQWYKATFNPTQLDAGTLACVTANASYSSFTSVAAFHPVSANEVVVLYLDEGGVRPVFIDSGATEHECPGRFMNPIKAMTTDDDDDIYALHYSGAVKVSNTVYVYFTAHNGSVKTVHYRLSDSGLSGNWTDIQEAIPEDLSTFQVANVIAYNSRIFIAGRFFREEDFDTDAAYTLLSWSDDGITFSLDRRVLSSLVDMRWMLAYQGGNIIFSSSNRYASESAPYQVIGESATNLDFDLISFNGSPLSSWTAKGKAGTEAYIDHGLISTGTFAKIEIGVSTSSGVVYTKYHDAIISSVQNITEDGDRDFTITLSTDGAWHTSSMSYPFYIEIDGKQGIVDPLRQFDKMYKTTSSDGETWALGSDFWSSATRPYGGGNHDFYESDDVWGPDLLSTCSHYPKFGDASTYEIHIFGWSRAGAPDTNPNTADSTDQTTDNDDFYGLLEIEDLNGNISTLVTTAGQLTSTYANPPQTYFKVADGSYPVIYTIPNPGEGFKIRKMGVRVVQPDGKGRTIYHPERIEMPGISAVYTSTINTGWGQKNTWDKWDLHDTLTLQVTTDNATDGDEVEGTIDLDEDYGYCAIIIGEVAFTRGGIDYIQDAQFVCQVASGGKKLEWGRAYPPGTGPTRTSSFQIDVGDCPLFNENVNDPLKRTWDDSILGYLEKPDKTHRYTFHIDESLRMTDSVIPASYVPYFYGHDDVATVRMYIDGTGTISNIVGGEFKIYIFQSTTKYEEFDLYPEAGTWYQDDGLADFYVETPPVGGGGDIEGPFTGWAKVEQSPVGFGGYAGSFSPVEKMYRIDPQLLVGEERTLTMSFRLKWSKYQASTLPDSLKLEISTSAGTTTWIVPAAEIENQTYLTQVDEMQVVTGVYDVYFRVLDVGDLDPPEGGAIQWSMSAELYIGTTPNLLQVPIPDGFDINIPGAATAGGGTITDDSLAYISNKRKGVPQILLATKPYSAWNFDAQGRFLVDGPYSYGGVLGLAEDRSNYVFGYIRPGKYGIGKCRDGVITIINESSDASIDAGQIYDVRFWHRDGKFGVEYKNTQDAWPTRGSQYTYEWTEDDEGISTQDDIWHVGIFSFINPPKFRTVAFRSSQSHIAAMEPDINPETGLSDLMEVFDSGGGVVDIEGVKYNYDYANIMFDPDGIGTIDTRGWGPFQLRNLGDWAPPFTTEYGGGHTFTGGLSLECLLFKWWAGATYADELDFTFCSTTAGYVFQPTEVQWKVWITTNGDQVLLRNRARIYGDRPNWYASGREKVWFTNGLADVTPVEEQETEIRHSVGAFCFVDSGDQIRTYGFMGFSGEHSATISSLLERFCKLAGTDANFPGDVTISSQALADGEGVSLQ